MAARWTSNGARTAATACCTSFRPGPRPSKARPRARPNCATSSRAGAPCWPAMCGREVGIPAVVGCGDATGRLKDGMLVTVSCAEGDTGRIYDGLLDTEVTEVPRGAMPAVA